MKQHHRVPTRHLSREQKQIRLTVLRAHQAQQAALDLQRLSSLR